jgi:hypothetical protein
MMLSTSLKYAGIYSGTKLNLTVFLQEKENYYILYKPVYPTENLNFEI